MVIPTFEEEALIGRTLEHVREMAADPSRLEVLVVDASSGDKTAILAEEQGARVVGSSRKGRAVQMNAGAFCGKGEVFYFLHADSWPPRHFDRSIREAVESGTPAGCFRLRFDHSHILLTLGGWFTRFGPTICRGGDQSLFITRPLFDRTGGFDEELLLMEDIDIIRRIRQRAPFKVLPEYLTTSARRFREKGVMQLYCCFSLIHLLYWMGASRSLLHKTYQRMIA